MGAWGPGGSPEEDRGDGGRRDRGVPFTLTDDTMRGVDLASDKLGIRGVR